MPTLIVNQQEVERLLPMAACVDVMASALGALATANALVPLRSVMVLPDGQSAFVLMPAVLGAQRVLGAKVISAFPGNQGTGLDTHQGAVLLFEGEHGALVAVVDASAITRIRTAAVSALATKLLAREDADVLAILGAGVQARAHLEAIPCVRPIRDVRIWSPHTEHARDLASYAVHRLGLSAQVSPSAERAVRGATVICTTTASRDPVLAGEWLSPGAHVNAVGACVPWARELDTRAVSIARLYVDRRESALREPGEILEPIKEGAITAAHIVAELGDVVVGKAAGRRSPNEITLFKSLGLAVEDLAAAEHVYQEAKRSGVGVAVALGGARDASP